jgi:hypothetical protein
MERLRGLKGGIKFAFASCAWVVVALAYSAEPDHFSRYRYAEDGFEATFPSKPLYFRTDKGPEFGHVNSYQAVVVNPFSQYSVFVNHSQTKLFKDASIDAHLEGIVRGLTIELKKAALKNKRRLRFLGFPALEYQFADKIEGVPVVFRGMVFIVDGDHIRLSQIYVPNDQGADVNYQRFTGSFRLTPIDAPLSNQRFEDRSRGVSFSPPDGWKKGAGKFAQVVAVFSNPAGHSITVLDSGTPAYVCDNYKAEIHTTQGLQATGQITVQGRVVPWFKSTVHHPAAKIRLTSIHYCFASTKGALILIGTAPEDTFFRSEMIFRKAAASSAVRN